MQTEPWSPAIVRGSAQSGVATFIEAKNGDLVDVEYRCFDHAVLGGLLVWPAYSFPDSCVYCLDCDELINVGRECECGGTQH